MATVQAIGMVIYTYSVLEERLEGILKWFEAVESWSCRPYAEFVFSPRAKNSIRIWKASPKNRLQLYQRLQVEQPWSWLHFGLPRGGLRSSPRRTGGLEVALGSRPQPWRGGESYRSPSEVYLEVHPQVLAESATGISGFLELGRQLWELLDGVYGFIDVETGVPLQDNFSRNAIQLFDNSVPKEYYEEYGQWQRLGSRLHKHVWKAFWGNYLGADHLRRLGGLQDMRRAHPRWSILPEYLVASYENGVERLRRCDCTYEWQPLASEGVLLTLSASPLEWCEPSTQEHRVALDAALAPIALAAAFEDSNWF
ncbi:MAG: hypothetical protein U0822_20605 [Anaerolineae bacterium]